MSNTTQVINRQPFRDWPILNFIREPVSVYGLGAKLEAAIASLSLHSRPKPTFSGTVFIDLSPESSGCGIVEEHQEPTSFVFAPLDSYGGGTGLLIPPPPSAGAGGRRSTIITHLEHIERMRARNDKKE